MQPPAQLPAATSIPATTRVARSSPVNGATPPARTGMLARSSADASHGLMLDAAGSNAPDVAACSPEFDAQSIDSFDFADFDAEAIVNEVWPLDDTGDGSLDLAALFPNGFPLYKPVAHGAALDAVQAAATRQAPPHHIAPGAEAMDGAPTDTYDDTPAAPHGLVAVANRARSTKSTVAADNSQRTATIVDASDTAAHAAAPSAQGLPAPHGLVSYEQV